MDEAVFYQTLPKKHLSAGALFQNERGKILIVKPTYKDYWSIPGGVVDSDESPMAGCIREVREELGLVVQELKLLCVDYVPAKPPRTESLNFIFFGGVLAEPQIAKIMLPPDELAGYKFVDPETATTLLSTGMGQRIPLCLAALESDSCLYLEDSKEK